MKVRAIRQAIATADDEWEVHFLSDSGEEFRVGAALDIPNDMIMFFGETPNGLVDAVDELDALDPNEWSQRLAWLETLESDIYNDDSDEELDDDTVATDADDATEPVADTTGYDKFLSGAIEGGDACLRKGASCTLPSDRNKPEVNTDLAVAAEML